LDEKQKKMMADEYERQGRKKKDNRRKENRGSERTAKAI
jgi:hypothetical protein